jgi:hypothetical protein
MKMLAAAALSGRFALMHLIEAGRTIVPLDS